VNRSCDLTSFLYALIIKMYIHINDMSSYLFTNSQRIIATHYIYAVGSFNMLIYELILCTNYIAIFKMYFVVYCFSRFHSDFGVQAFVCNNNMLINNNKSDVKIYRFAVCSCEIFYFIAIQCQLLVLRFIAYFFRFRF